MTIRLGALARALEAAIDKNLGIDATQANAALESAFKEEGSLLDTAVGKETSMKLKEKTEELAKKVTVKAIEKTTPSKSGPRKVPIPDDFFSDFGLEKPTEKPSTQAKGDSLQPEPSVQPQPPKEVQVEKLATSAAQSSKSAAESSKPAAAGASAEEKRTEAVSFVEDDELAGFASNEPDVLDDYLSGSHHTSTEGAPKVAALQINNDEADGASKSKDQTRVPDEEAAPVHGHRETHTSEDQTGPVEVVADVGTPARDGGGGGEGGEGGGKTEKHLANGDMSVRVDDGEMARLKQQLGKREEELAASQAMVEKLRTALSKSGAMLQQVTIENEDKLQELEGHILCEKERADRAEKAFSELKNASKNAAEAAEQLAQVKDEKEGLLKEGQKLMQEKQQLESVIKQLRKQLKEQEGQMLKLREAEEECRLIITDLESQLDQAGLSSKTTEEAMAQIRGMSHETAKKLQEREKDKQALLSKCTALERQVATLTQERDAAQRRAEEAMKDAEDEAKRIVDREKRLVEKESQLKVEMLTDSLEGLQAAMRRLESQSAAKEQRLKADLDDLQQRCADAEGRCQELSSAVPESTRPLLRQIESLQQGFAEKQRIWEQVESNLRQRSTEAEAESRGAAERERIAQQRLKQQTDSVAVLEARVEALQVENSRMGAEQRAAREEAEGARRALQDANAELEVLQAAATKRAQEILDNKALHRRLMLEEADKFSAERDAWQREKEDLLRRVEGHEAIANEQQQSLEEPSLDDRRGSGYADLRIGLGRDGRATDPWEKLAARSPFYDRPNQDSQLSALQQRCGALERERDTLAEELGYAAMLRQRLERDAGDASSLRISIAELEKQLEHALELLGAREEEIDDLKATLEEQREIFRQTLQGHSTASMT